MKAAQRSKHKSFDFSVAVGDKSYSYTLIPQCPISKIKPYDENPRNNAEAVTPVANSIQALGFNNVITCGPDFRIAAGHTRYKSAIELGMTEVPVLIAYHLTAKDFVAYNLADNKTATIAEWDEELLTKALSDLMAAPDDDALVRLEATGFEDDEIEDLLRSGPDSGLTDPDAVPDPPLKPESRPGDLYLLGNHRLLCGDSTKLADVKLLMDGCRSDMVFTDPPYNVDYSSKDVPNARKKPLGRILNDNMSDKDWQAFCSKFLQHIKDFNLGDIYLWGASGPEGMKMRLQLVAMGCHWSATIIWNKSSLVLSRSKFQRKYEPCFYGSFEDDSVAAPRIAKPCLYGWFAKSSHNGNRKQADVWDVDKPHRSDLHPTTKPVELATIAIWNSSKSNGSVLDLFIGSGTTIIGCEMLGRSCFGMELDPVYCDVAVRRWEDFTGKKAERIRGAK